MNRSFSELTDEEFISHSEHMLHRHSSAEERKDAIAYLQYVLSKDAETIKAERVTVREKERLQRKRQRKMDELLAVLPLDFSRQSALFVDSPPTPAEITTRLTQDNTETFLVADRTADLVISGNNVLVSGRGNQKSARLGQLANSITVTGTVKVSGDNVVIRDIDFVATGNYAVLFSGACQNITVENCTFSPPAGNNDARWWSGIGEFFSGDVTIKNCRVQDFTHVLLADFSTESSSTPSRALRHVSITECYFKNNLGSMAARGKLDEPILSYEFSRNKIEQAAMHASYWDAHEVSGAFLKAVCVDNTYVGPVGRNQQDGKVGFFQMWSRSDKPWSVTYRGNALQNTRVGVKIATNNTFYSPNTTDEDFLIDLTEPLSNVFKAASFLYKKNDGTTASLDKWLLDNGDYTPENISTFPNVPSVINPHTYTVVQPSSS